MGLFDSIRRRWVAEEESAIAMKTVVRGDLPACFVAHAEDGLWVVGDGTTDWDDEERLQLVPLAEVVKQDATLAEVEDLPMGYQAERSAVGARWVRRPMARADDTEEAES
jgi:hypothetical protein